MAEHDLSAFEAAVKRVPGVLGCVVLANPDGTPAEVQAFTKAGVDRDAVESAIVDEAARRGMDAGIGQTFVFELDAEPSDSDSASLEEAAGLAEQEARSKGPLGVLHALGTLHSIAASGPAPGEAAGSPARLPVRRVQLSSSSWASDAQVTLGAGGGEVTGTASGDKSEHGLRVVAEATLQAVAQLGAGSGFALKGVQLANAFGRETVLVLVQLDGGTDVLGAALVRTAPVTEAAVRATLDAINRRVGAR
jgi:hypothetical protein